MYFEKNNIAILKGVSCLQKIMDTLENSIAVAGTHGKTTTSSMLSVF